MAASQKERPEEVLDKIALACLDALNQSTTKGDFERWIKEIFVMANPDNDDDLDDDGDVDTDNE